jgi:hypothetical protein
MKRLIKSLLLVTVIMICFALLGCATFTTTEEPVEPEPEETEEPETMEEELTEEEEEIEEETTQGSSSQSSTSGSGFKHEVKMEIDGIVETDKNEGWWETD